MTPPRVGAEERAELFDRVSPPSVLCSFVPPDKPVARHELNSVSSECTRKKPSAIACSLFAGKEHVLTQKNVAEGPWPGRAPCVEVMGTEPYVKMSTPLDAASEDEPDHVVVA